MLIRIGGPAIWIRSIVFVTPYKGCFSLFDQYLVVFGLFLPKTEEQNYHTHKILFNVNMWIRVVGDVLAIFHNIKFFYNIIINSVNVDKGEGWVGGL